MMGADEAGTLTTLKLHRETVFDPTVAAHKGRVVKLIGDGTLVEFGSVVDAVKCALAIQRAVKAAAGPDGGGIVLRIGINLGDVIIDGDDIYGDGVNVAARLEPLASPGGVCVASIVNESVGSRIDVRFTDGGEVTVKNIDRPIRVWKWHPDSDPVVAQPAAPVTVASAKAQSEPPSIAVLPFNNMSGDPEQEYFSDGITEDIITDLSKVGGLIVIARNSSFTYKGRSVDIRNVGRELGVRSVLEGSIRRAGNRVRITAQLISADSGGHLWAERYDRDLTDIFAVQDEVTGQIVNALKVTLTPGEKSAIATGGTENAEAHDCVLRARRLLSRASREIVENAIVLLKRAIELDPDYGQAYSAMAMAHMYDFQNLRIETPEKALELAKRNVDIAIEKDASDSYGHFVSGIVLGYLGERPRAIAAFNKAVELSPNDAPSINAQGVSQIFEGRPEQAIPLIERAIRLDPAASQQSIHFLGMANMLLGKMEVAAALFRERILLVPETDLSRALYAATLGHLGRLDEARQVWREMMQINPKYSFRQHMSRLLFAREQDAALIAEGLAKAGLPE